MTKEWTVANDGLIHQSLGWWCTCREIPDPTLHLLSINMLVLRLSKAVAWARVETNCWILKATRTCGMVFRPSKDLKFDLYTDANFAGLWNTEDSHDPISVKSWTGFVVTLGEVPILWGSKLQIKIALSTTEAEYIALSTAMQELIPIWLLLHRVGAVFGLKRHELKTVWCVWEDNNGALTNAAYPNTTPRTNHIACKYHWFQEHLVPGENELMRIDTKLQRADIFTKWLPRPEFALKWKMVVESW